MDWENKHFEGETVLSAPAEGVRLAMERFVQQSLPDWSVSPTPDGFDASGRSGFHHAEAHVRMSPDPNGTKVSVELLVRRSNGFGYMLFDLGGYYDHLIRKWLGGIWQQVAGVRADPGGHAPVPPYGAMTPNATVGARVVVMDARGQAYLGVVREVRGPSVLVAYDEGEERWVPATAAHVVERRENV
jgi:hypothetical protein